MTERPTYAKLLVGRSFGALWLAQLVSQSGGAFLDVTILWLALTMTNSTTLLGLTQAAVLLPSILASPVAGVHANMGSVILLPNCQPWTPDLINL